MADLHIVFTGFPGPANECVFVEVETPDGKSINAGEWRQREDGLVELVLAAAPVEPVVKALEWNLTCTLKDGQTVWCAEAPGLNMTYSIWSSPDGSAVSPFGSSNIHNGFFETLDEGKAAAQADYESRIRSALTPPAAHTAVDVFPFHGYAPGSYWCKCANCLDTFMADKRCITCAPCAIARYANSLKATRETA